MSETVRHAVWRYERHLGSLYHHNNFTWFEFDDDYLADPDRPVLGLKFEEQLGGRVAANLRLPPWFSNLLPEGPLRRLIATDGHVSADREMELLAHVGHDLPGAIRVRPDGMAPVDDLDTIAKTITAMPMPGRPASQSWRMSLAGVGLKFSVLRNGDRFSCPATGLGGDWILELPDGTYPDVPVNEYTMMRLAAATGIDVPEVVLVHRDEISGLPDTVWPHKEQYAFGIRRFDRDSTRALIHIEDPAQVRSVYPIQKYEGNFETVAALIYRGHDLTALTEFVRRLSLFILIGNGDAHLKNWSLIYRDHRIPTLSPAYDIVATEPYRPDGGPEDLGLKFSSNLRFESVRAHQFTRLGRKLVAAVDLADTVADTVASTTRQWPRFADELHELPLVRDAVTESIGRRSVTLLQHSRR